MKNEYVLSNNERLIKMNDNIYEVIYGSSVQVEGGTDNDLFSIKLSVSGKKLVKGCNFDGHTIKKLYIGKDGGLFVEFGEEMTALTDDGYRKKKKYNHCIIAIDFDGTIVTHEYPRVGKPLALANEVIQMLTANGHECFLYTMRDGIELAEAKEYCEENGLEMCGYNRSPQQFSASPKQYAQFYIDDAAVGCPLSFNPNFSRRPYVDWYEVAKYLTACGLLTPEQLDVLRKL